MIGHQVTAALRAVLALAHRCLLERCDMLRPGRDPHRFRLPQGERVYRPAGPRTAGTAMAITHSFRRTRDLHFDRTAKAASGMIHDSSASLQTIESWSVQFAPGEQHRNVLPVTAILVTEHADEVALLEHD